MSVKKLDDDAVAQRVKKSRVTISRYRRGIEEIPTAVVKKLVRMSRGQMKAADLIGTNALEAAQ